MGALLETALSLASRGLHVFPYKPRDKEPAVWNGLRAATTDQNVIRGWWRSRDLNIGLATGERSGVFVVDIDAEAELAKLESRHGTLPGTVESITTKGRHIYFVWPGRRIPNSASKIAPGIDVRGDGGYVLAPPSIHPSGKPYAWSVDSASSFAAAPDWIITGAIAASFSPRGKLPCETSPSTVWAELVAAGVAEGARNVTFASLAGYLLRHRIDVDAVLEILRLWNETRCRPPLPDADVLKIVDSIAGREYRRRAGLGR